MKMKNKMMLGFGLLISGIFIAVMVILSIFVKRNIIESQEYQLETTTNSVVKQLEGFIEASIKNYLRGISEQNRKILEDNNISNLDFFNEQIIGESGYIYITDTNGIIISHHDKSQIGENLYGDNSLIKQEKIDNQYIRYEENGRIKITYNTIFQQSDWTISLVAYEDELTDLIDFESLKEQILSIRIGEEGYPYIFTAEGKSVVHPTLPLGTDLYNRNDADGIPIFKNMIEEGKGMIYYRWAGPDEVVKKKFCSFRTIKFPNWIIAVSGYNNDYFSILDTINTVLLILSLSSLILILVVVYIISSIQVRSICNITELLKDISEGNGDLTKKLSTKSKDETGLMAEYFNKFTDNIASLINNVKDSSQVNVEVKEELSANFEETVSSLSQIDSNLQNVNNQMKHMDGKVQNSTQAVKEIIMGIDNLDSQIQEQSNAVEESSVAVSEMVSSLKNISEILKNKIETAKGLVRTSKNGGNQIQLTKTTFEEGISAKISEISEMTVIIKNIAAQTNLLSMNAAIEAAHAGDSGRGFAVVASEIRKLAEESSKNSKNISNVIKAIVKSIGQTGEHIQYTNEAFTSLEKEIIDLDIALGEILNSSQDLSSGGEEVIKVMNDLNNISSIVFEKSTEINKNSSIVSDSIKQVTEISGEVSNAVTEAATGTSQINTTMSISQNLIIDLGDRTVGVHSEVKKFKTA